jgi:protein-S-isoprenylcysteine O-methyltransferase Ste14
VHLVNKDQQQADHFPPLPQDRATVSPPFALGGAEASVPGAACARWRVPLGYPVGVACILFSRPTLASVTIGAVIALWGLVVRAAAAGHLRRANGISDTGPYARTRNPLYFGSAVLAAGFCVASHSLISAFLLAAYFVVFYPTVMRREERELRLNYGVKFEEYAKRVPIFFPKLGSTHGAGKTQFSFAQYLHNREYNAAIGTAAVIIILSMMAVWLR